MHAVVLKVGLGFDSNSKFEIRLFFGFFRISKFD